MPYSHLTLASARSLLANRLADAGEVRWIAAELDRYLREALRTWSALTASYRDRGVFTLTSQQAWYDLPTMLPSLRGYTVTDYDLITDLQYALLEPASPSVWTGTSQFTLADLVGAIQRRRDQFLRETSAILTRETLTITPSPAGRESLPETVAAIRRAAWLDTDGLITPLRRDDEWGADHFAPQWPQQMRRPPAAYSVSVTPPLRVQLIPPPQDTGALDLLCVETASALVAGTSSVLEIPDDWTWVIKWGALADLLSRDGLAFDPARSAYAEARWQQGLQLAMIAPVVLSARINDAPCLVSAVSDADAYSPLWQSVPGIPRRLVIAGQNLLASWPPPGVAMAGGTWSVTLDVVATMPVPTLDQDYLQIGDDLVDTILDYAQHLALVKEGPAVLQQAQPLVDRFLRAAGVSVQLQQAQQPSRTPLVQQQTQDQFAQPAQVA